jgi:hypothetical protein
MISIQPIRSGAGTFLADDSLLESLFLDKVHAGSLVGKPIKKIDNVHGKNRIF